MNVIKMKSSDIRSLDFYSQKYSEDSWRQQRRKDAEDIVNQLEVMGVVRKGMKTLDAGCGSGELAAELKIRYNADSWGLEMNDQAIQAARSLHIHVKKTDLDKKWPFNDRAFDLVIGTEIIEHVLNPDHFIKESNRILNKNGILVLTTPNLCAWFNRLLVLIGYQPFFLEASTVDKTVGLGFTRRMTPNRTPVGHIRCFTLRAIKDLLELHSFAFVGCKGFPGYYFPKYMVPMDTLFSHAPDLAADLFVVARKK